ncbi:type II CAAX endopeptidase family protein [Paenibacillus sp. D2_2]|uniref:CPBP family intramembrane glutamic endopeptidase n=1 Tax=Paenibacillus sp. D2_2 TaxID=3073092 RepID=UPI002815B402|nr:type II CAAX endopeptidase family protein [Paenibacillus sp. D2_2]WMT41212.1 type II CAAX endopeptidase family protein [Paenibacillus sp. D2_2]
MPRIASPAWRIALAIVANITALLTIMLPFVLTGTLNFVLENYGVQSVMNIVVGVIGTVVTFMIYRYVDRKPVRKLGFTFRRKDVLFSIGVLVLTLLNALVGLWFIQGVHSYITVQFDASRILNGTYISLLLLAFVAWIIASMQEEVLSRGYLLAQLQRLGLKNAILISSLLFLLVHIPFRGLHLYHAISIVMGGIVYAYMYLKSGSLWVSCVAHGIYDFVDAILFNVNDVSLFVLQDSISMGDKLPYKIVLALCMLGFTYLIYGRNNGVMTPSENLQQLWGLRTLSATPTPSLEAQKL